MIAVIVMSPVLKVTPILITDIQLSLSIRLLYQQFYNGNFCCLYENIRHVHHHRCYYRFHDMVLYLRLFLRTQNHTNEYGTLIYPALPADHRFKEPTSNKTQGITLLHVSPGVAPGLTCTDNN